jgi:hypothetical protein
MFESFDLNKENFPLIEPFEPVIINGPFKTIACWSDLLGFGAQLAGFDWNLNKDETNLLVKRLVNFSLSVTERSSHNEQGLFVNDGIIRTFDHEFYNKNINPHEILIWLDSCIVSHITATGREQDYKLPGVRTIICEGQVLSFKSDEGEFKTVKQIKHPDKPIQPISTQLNTALSKCYLADSLGSKAGLKKGSLYIEDKIIQQLVNLFECKIYGDYLFIYGEPKFSDISKYHVINKLLLLHPKESIYHCLPQQYVSWLKLGTSVRISSDNLEYVLIEIEAYNPVDECDLFWFDTARGNMHGIWKGGIQMQAKDGSDLFEHVQKGSFEYSLIEEYITLSK